MFGLGLGKLGGAVRAAGFVPAFSPLSLFANGEQGAWYDPSDLSTMFQDSAGTIPVTADGQPVGLILDKSKGLALGPELVTNSDFSNGMAEWSGTAATISVETEELKIVNTGSGFGSAYRYISGLVIGKWYKCTAYYRAVGGAGVILRVGDGANIDVSGANGTSGTLSLMFLATATSHIIYLINNSSSAAIYSFWDNVSLKELAGNHASQTTATARPLYKTDGTYHWLQFDGIDDSLSTAAINFTSTDKMSVFAGLYKQSDAAAAMLLELNTTLLSGSFYITAPETAAPNFGFGLNMTGAVAVVASPFAATAKFVVCSAFDGSFVNSSNSIRVRINSVLVSTTGGGNSEIGSFANAQLFIGRRNNTNLPFNGRIYSLIVRGALSSPQEITDTETWVNGKTGAY